MTATEVDGTAVTGTEPAYTNLKREEQDPVPYKTVIKLLLADGTYTYGCVYDNCTYTEASSAQSVASHYKTVHEGWSPGPKRAENARKGRLDLTPYAGMTVEEFFGNMAELHGEIERLEAQMIRSSQAFQDRLGAVAEDRNAWKRKAQDAQRALAPLRKLFKDE
jgi:hypothetical protein